MKVLRGKARIYSARSRGIIVGLESLDFSDSGMNLDLQERELLGHKNKDALSKIISILV